MNEEINELSKKLTNAVQFWIDQGDSERYFYDVKNFLTWLCDYVAMQNNDNFCE